MSDSKVFIIAEMGVNHNSNIELAKKMIDCAADAGADAVKTQSFLADALVVAVAEKAAYQQKNTGEGTQRDMLKKLEISRADYIRLSHYAEKRGIQFFSTPFDLQSIHDLASLDMPVYKIPSGEITNLPYLIKIGRLGKPVILSTGMSTIPEIRMALETLQKSGTENITLLHCNTQYPTPFEDANLRAIQTLQREFGLPTGFSDHTPGIEAALAAVALGAVMIEKHFTLDKKMDGPDHKASLEPDELCMLVRGVRIVEEALGSGVKQVTASERANREVARKSIVAACFIPKGERFTELNITVKRPGNGISPMQWFEVIGKAAERDFLPDELITVAGIDEQADGGLT